MHAFPKSSESDSDIDKNCTSEPSIPLPIGPQAMPENSFLSKGPFGFHSLSRLDGDKHPASHDGKPLRFVTQPSSKHFDNRNIDCKILKYVKVPSPGKGMILFRIDLFMAFK